MNPEQIESFKKSLRRLKTSIKQGLLSLNAYQSTKWTRFQDEERDSDRRVIRKYHKAANNAIAKMDLLHGSKSWRAEHLYEFLQLAKMTEGLTIINEELAALCEDNERMVTTVSPWMTTQSSASSSAGREEEESGGESDQNKNSNNADKVKVTNSSHNYLGEDLVYSELQKAIPEAEKLDIEILNNVKKCQGSRPTANTSEKPIRNRNRSIQTEAEDLPEGFGSR